MISLIGMYFRAAEPTNCNTPVFNYAQLRPLVACRGCQPHPSGGLQHSPNNYAFAKLPSLMATAKNASPLTALLRACKDDDERCAFAEMAGTTVNYLYALAGCHRGQPRAGLAVGIEDASVILNRQTKGRTPIVTVREIATMCAVSGLSKAD
jgi:hypothetical protein